MTKTAQDAALAAMWAAADRRPIGWISRTCAKALSMPTIATTPPCCRKVPQRKLLRQFYARYQAAQAAAIEDLRREWVPPPIDDAAWEEHLRWLALREVRFSCKWLLPHEKRLRTSRQYRLIRERQNRFLHAHPQYLEAVKRKAGGGWLEARQLGSGGRTILSAGANGSSVGQQGG
jgi:hypothetical protein